MYKSLSHSLLMSTASFLSPMYMRATCMCAHISGGFCACNHTHTCAYVTKQHSYVLIFFFFFYRNVGGKLLLSAKNFRPFMCARKYNGMGVKKEKKRKKRACRSEVSGFYFTVVDRLARVSFLPLLTLFHLVQRVVPAPEF